MKKTFEYLLTLTLTIFAVLFAERFSIYFVEPKIIANSKTDWRTSVSEFNGSECYRQTEGFGFEPVWGKCSFPVVSNKSSDAQVLGESVNDNYKILILGDSNTYRANLQIPLEDNLSSLKVFGDRKVEVVKVGVESYNTSQEIDILKKYLIEIDPDLVIIQFTLNDFDASPIVIKDQGKLIFMASPQEPKIPINKFLFENSSIYRVVLFKKHLLGKETTLGVDPKIWNSKLETMQSALDDFKKIIDNSGKEGLFVIYPIFSQKQWSGELNAIKVLLNSRRIPYIDMLEESKPFGGPEAFENKDTNDKLHPTRDFDNLVVNAISSYILTNYGKP